MRRKQSRIVVRTARRESAWERVWKALRERLDELAEGPRRWCAGRSPWPRLPLLLWRLWILVSQLRAPGYQSLFGGLNFGIHELGHILFMPLGQFMGVAGGTLAETGAPFVAMGMFWRQRDFFAISFCWLWLGTALHGVARYMADAREQSLFLLSPFPGEPIHDWNFLLSRLGLLSFDRLLSGAVAGAANLAIVIFLVGGGWLLWQMGRGPSREAELSPPWD